MNPAKSVYEVAAEIVSGVREGSSSRSVSGSTDPSRCRCNSAFGAILAIITAMQAEEIEAIVAGRHHDPFSVLGPHDGEVRAWLPQAEEAFVLVGATAPPMQREHPKGFL